MTKEDLLKTGCFKNNNYLDKYIELFSDNLDSVQNYDTRTTTCFILPKAYFNHFKLPLDNSPDNLKVVTYKNFFLAKYYLLYCTKQPLLKHARYYFSWLNVQTVKYAVDFSAEAYEKIMMYKKELIKNNIKRANSNLSKVHKNSRESVVYVNQSLGKIEYWNKIKSKEIKQ